MTGVNDLDPAVYDRRRVWAEIIRVLWPADHVLEIAAAGGPGALVDLAHAVDEVDVFVEGDFLMVLKPDGTLAPVPSWRVLRPNPAKVDRQIAAVVAAMDRGEAEEWSAKAFEGPFEGDEPPGEDVIHVLIQGERIFTFHRALVVDGWPAEGAE